MSDIDLVIMRHQVSTDRSAGYTPSDDALFLSRIEDELRKRKVKGA